MNADRDIEELRTSLYAANDVYITALSRFNEARSALNDAEGKYAAIYAALYGTPKQQEEAHSFHNFAECLCESYQREEKRRIKMKDEDDKVTEANYRDEYYAEEDAELQKEEERDEMRKQMQDEEMREEMRAEENAEIIREIQAEEELG